MQIAEWIKVAKSTLGKAAAGQLASNFVNCKAEQ
jgi:hypothetical protein